MPQRLRDEKIEKDNTIFLERLARTLARKNIDNKIESRRDAMLRLRKLQLEQRKRLEEKRIIEGNQRLLKRILEVPGCYDLAAWEADALRHEEHLKNMTEFPELQQQTRASIVAPLKARAKSAGAVNRIKLPPQPPLASIVKPTSASASSRLNRNKFQLV